MLKTKMVYLGIKGSVVAIDSGTGRQLWMTRLKGTDFVNVVLDGENLYAATHGEVSCLDPRSGTVRWHNPLKGLGWGLVSIAVEGSAANGAGLLGAEKRRREEQAAAASGAAAAG